MGRTNSVLQGVQCNRNKERGMIMEIMDFIGFVINNDDDYKQQSEQDEENEDDDGE
jgi:hypothetical protein